MPISLTGQLLVATPHTIDPNFFRSVVFVVQHGPEGALGLILNRTTREPLLQHLPEWAHFTSNPAVVFFGGPVSTNVTIGLAENPVPQPGDFTPILQHVGLFGLDAEPDLFAEVDNLRVYSGYSGWQPTQLEHELASGGWFLADAEPDDIFSVDPPSLWRRVIERQPGRLAFYSTFPLDPRLN